MKKRRRPALAKLKLDDSHKNDVQEQIAFIEQNEKGLSPVGSGQNEMLTLDGKSDFFVASNNPSVSSISLQLD